jgi:DNA-binding CsgD family transcriptional regulator
MAQQDAEVDVRNKPKRLVCTAVGDQVMVAVLPSDRVEPRASERMSPREIEVLTLVARGLATPRIARALGVKPSTVRTHVEHIRTKLGVNTRAQAVHRAIATGQLPRP